MVLDKTSILKIKDSRLNLFHSLLLAIPYYKLNSKFN